MFANSISIYPFPLESVSLEIVFLSYLIHQLILLDRRNIYLHYHYVQKQLTDSLSEFRTKNKCF